MEEDKDMVNMTVIHVKTLAKYLVGIVIVIIITIIFLTYAKSGKIEKKQEQDTLPQKEMPSLIACLDEVIPGIHQVNHEEEEATVFQLSEANFQRRMLTEEYSMMANTKEIEMEEEKQQEVAEETKPEEEEKTVEEVSTEVTTEEQPSAVKNTYNTEIRGVKIRNESKYEVTEDMVVDDQTYNFQKMLIFHTHTCESYTPSDAFSYTHNGNFRTTDRAFSVARVGDELQKNLEQYGISVIHDTTYHDYPNYSGSYGRSLNTVDSILKNNPEIDIVFDLHRDAISDMTYAPKVKIR